MFNRRLMKAFKEKIKLKIGRIQNFCKQTKEVEESKIRNISIIAHIDAGKTTTTERFLYYSGKIASPGEVHDGDTITDYMPEERERGITITSAFTSFAWRKHCINLLDTPGHVDFTIEVERCLSIIDGTIVILDASAGVEAQTATVWLQANKFKLPRIVYLNKMDRTDANINLCLKSLQRFNCNALLIHLPIYKKKKFTGLIDLLTMKKYLWKNEMIGDDDGRRFCESIFAADDEMMNDFDGGKSFYNETFLKQREHLIGQLSEHDTRLSEAILEYCSLSEIPTDILVNALRRATIKNEAIPVLCGSSYRNVGVQMLMNSILSYLPSPLEKRKSLLKYYDGALCALVFKISFHKIFGSLTFLRIYSGFVNSNSKIFNINRNTTEKIGKILLPFADKFQEINSAGAGSIIAISGLKTSNTGDTLTSGSDIAEKVKQTYSKMNSLPIDNFQPILAGIETPVPVYFCVIEAPSVSKQLELDKALENLQREDPSLTVETSVNNETIISGMGELHIEIIKNRLLREYNIDAHLGPLQIAYKETIIASNQETFVLDKLIGGQKNHVSITLKVKPNENTKTLKRLVVATNIDSELSRIRPDRLKAIENGVQLALSNGPLIGFPLVNLDVELINFNITFGTTLPIISAAASQCITRCLKKCSPTLLEPLMKVEIILPEKYLKSVLNLLTTKRSIIENVDSRESNVRVICSLSPLSELKNFSTDLRKLTSGETALTMKFAKYQKMNEHDQRKAIDNVQGFL